jgi:hypothetical protein
VPAARKNAGIAVLGLLKALKQAGKNLGGHDQACG